MTAIRPENVWFNEIQLSDKEELTLSYPANHTQGKRAVGGKLFVTNCRIAFASNRLDAQMGGDTWEVPLSDLDSAGIDKPRLRISEIFSGTLRTRLSIHSTNGKAQYFVVGNPEVVASEISSAIEQQAEQVSCGNGGQRL